MKSKANQDKFFSGFASASFYRIISKSLILVVVSLLLNACMARQFNSTQTASRHDLPSTEKNVSLLPQSQSSHLPLLPTTAGEESLDEATNNSVALDQFLLGTSYRVNRSIGSEELILSTNKGKPEYKVDRLSNPDRLVLDVSGLKVVNNKELKPQGEGLIQKLRFGDHGTHGRLVLDLNNATNYHVTPSDGVIKISLNNNSSDLSSDNFSDRKMASLKPELVDFALQDDEQNIVGKPNVVSVRAIPNVLTESDKDDSSSAKSSVRSVALQSLGKGDSVLIIKLDVPAKFLLKRAIANEYKLVIQSAKLGAGIQPSIVSQDRKSSIKAISVTENSNNVELTLFADVTKDLVATKQGDNIVVGTTQFETAPGEDFSVRAEGELNGDILAEEDEKPADLPTKEPTVTLTETPDQGEAVDTALPTEDDLSDLFGADSRYTGRLISLDLQDTEIDNALRIIAEVSNLNIIASDDVTGKVTLRLIDVPWDQALDVILKTNNLDKVQEGNVVRIAPVEKLRAEREALRQAQQAEDELEPLRVQYIRISYAKAAELQPLVETVITERGSVAYDERSNQLIVKDISKGLKNVARLVQKLDLRTPQVLIETQIVEAQRSFIRDLGSELGFTFIRSPETGNALGYNFPNSVQIGGSAVDVSGEAPTPVGPIASFFPSTNPSSAVSALFSSADGTKSLNMRISAAESEGRARVVSRPSVAVTNNSPAVIKSVTRLRVTIPSGGVSVATGQGANATGTGGVATEQIEVGIVLNVTAQASPDYYVLLDINAKSSTLGPKADAVDEIPPELERSTTSSVLVSSGQTFAMGGIYRVTENTDVTGVPFFKDIPVLGHFFRRTGVNDLDEELIFFITPRIIEGSFDDASMKSVS